MRAGQEIASYKVRRGRTGPTSAAARDRLWPVFGLEQPYRDLVRSRPLALEIGFGMGAATALMAAAEPDLDLLAVEVHPAGIAALLRRLERAALTNVRVIDGDAVPVLEALPEGCLAQVRVFFPDPWPKARHVKRRLLRPSFADLVAPRLEPGGFLHLATDSLGYVDHAREVLTGWDVELLDRPSWRPTTAYEQRALAAGRPSFDLIARPRR